MKSLGEILYYALHIGTVHLRAWFHLTAVEQREYEEAALAVAKEAIRRLRYDPLLLERK